MNDHIEFSQAPEAEIVLTPEAVEFVADLHRNFNDTRLDLLAARHKVQAKIDAGRIPDFDPETAHIRAGNWTVAAPPADLLDRRTELTGPADRATIVASLNSGARVFMADFEDAFSPSWANVVAGQAALIEAYQRTITCDGASGSVIGVVDAPATLMVRTRGWHLDEPNFTVDGRPVSAALIDFGLCVFHNWRSALANGSGPYFYLAKLENHREAALWNDVFDFAETTLGMDPGTIRATVLIEHILAAFEMDEILYVLRNHATGLHTGNWDYLFSIIKTFRLDQGFVLPDRRDIGVTVPFMRAFTELLVATCHRRGAHAIGGMSGVVPDYTDPQRTSAELRKVTVDKRREAGDGFDGTRIANPDLVDVAVAEFDKVLGERPNQIERQRDDVYVTAGDLLAVRSTRGQISDEGLRINVRFAISYIAEWLGGNGNVLIDDHIEDTAMAELCRSQIWTWIHHQAEMSNGLKVDSAMVTRIISEETTALLAAAGPDEAQRVNRAAALVSELTLHDEFADFWTVDPDPAGSGRRGRQIDLAASRRE